MHHVFQGAAERAGALLAAVRRVDGGGGSVRRGLAHRGHPAIEDQCEGPAFRPRLGREVADELAIGGEALSLPALQATLRGEIGICYYEVLAHGVRADRLEQEALARSVASHEEAEGCAAVLDEVEVREQGANLGLAADGDVRQADSRYDAAFQRVEDDGGDALGNARRAVDIDWSRARHASHGERSLQGRYGNLR